MKYNENYFAMQNIRYWGAINEILVLVLVGLILLFDTCSKGCSCSGILVIIGSFFKGRANKYSHLEYICRISLR